MPLINLHGITLDVSIQYACSTPSTEYENGYREIEWTCTYARDEIGEVISPISLDLICNEYQSEIERAIWAQIEGNRS